MFDGAKVSKTGSLVSRTASASAPSRRVSAARVPIGILLYLGSVRLVGAATTGIFFGSGFVLLSQPSEQTHTEFATRHSDAGVDPLRPGVPSASAEDSTSFAGGVSTLSSMETEPIVITPA
jgi:hypothetical protein